MLKAKIVNALKFTSEPWRGNLVGFDWLKFSAIFSIFLFHSNFTYQYSQMIFVAKYLLSVFFFIAAYFAYQSMQKKTIKQYVWSKIKNIYLPYAVFLLIYFYVLHLYDWLPKDSFFVYLSGLSVFSRYDNPPYVQTFIWFIPCVLVFFGLFAFLHYYVKSDKLKLLIIVIIYLIQIIASALLSPFGLTYDFSQYLWVFSIGYFISKRRLSIPILLLLFILPLTFFSGPFTAVTNNFFTNIAFFTIWFTKDNLFGISSVLLVLPIFTKIRFNIRKIIAPSLFVLLLEPLINQSISNVLFNESNYWNVTYPNILIQIGCGFIATLSVAFLVYHVPRIVYKRFLTKN